MFVKIYQFLIDENKKDIYQIVRGLAVFAAAVMTSSNHFTESQKPTTFFRS